MKRSGAPLASVVATVLLTAFALALSGCAGPSGPPPKGPGACNRPGIPVTVFVSYNPETKTAVTPNKTVYLCEGKDWVEWIPSEGIISDDIRWESGSPFDEKPQHVNKVLRSKPSKRGTAGKSFNYGIDLVLPSGKIPVDPKIEIMP